ncbi:MAG: hypothetical protein DMF61_09930 [Blastocatellia bacterium AA13]|nr:MAG: hypothetical protein DMF61_09930 [Blastocatellia bacterium AA13]
MSVSTENQNSTFAGASRENGMKQHQNASAGPVQNEIRTSLKEILARVSGVSPADLRFDSSLIELGFDSLMLIQAAQTIEDALAVKIPFRMLVEENPSIASLADFVASELKGTELKLVDSSSTATQALPVQAPAHTQPNGNGSAAHKTAGVAPAEIPTPFPPASEGTRRIEPMNDGSREWIIAQQLEIMARQLDLLSDRAADVETVAASVTPAELRNGIESGNGSHPAVEPVLIDETLSEFPNAPPEPTAFATAIQPKPEPFVPHHPVQSAPIGGLSEKQRFHLEGLVTRLSERTRGSKEITQGNRSTLADSRASTGFNLLWKEILYPLVVARASGCRVWDVDGNEYVDIGMGYGALLFGHSPDFILNAVEEQMKQGIQLGLVPPLGGEASGLVCELTGSERATFCNSGTEAVMIAIRLARTVTGRSKVALFSGAYHGFFDEVLVRAGTTPDGRPRTIPVAPGVPPSVADNITVLEYGTPESLDFIRRNASELAAVLVEPVQSRRPDFQPLDFLRELRSITDASRIALIFDEMITGFRSHPGGVQALFGIKADLATYGKAAGGGFPVGVIAGKAAYMDAIDGGMWSFGDASYPRKERTFIAGTYFIHPVIMAAVCAALSHVKANSAQLHKELNERSDRFIDTLNTYFEQEAAPIRMVHFASQFRFEFAPGLKHSDLFFYHLLEKGVYTWEGRNCFVSTAHTDEDLKYVIEAVKQTVAEMRKGGFLPEAESKPADYESSIADYGSSMDDRSTPFRASVTGHNGDRGVGAAPAVLAVDKPGAASADIPASDSVRSLPLTVAQRELWILTRLGDNASRAYNESMALYLNGSFDRDAMGRAVNRLIARHEALRISFSPDGDFQYIAPEISCQIPFIDCSKLAETAREEEINRRLAFEAGEPFDLTQAPLMRASIIRVEEARHILTLAFHHIITDGWSNGILLRDISALYQAELTGRPAALPQPMQFSEFAEWLVRRSEGADAAKAESYWLSQFADGVPVLDLPSDRPRPPFLSYAGGRISNVIDSILLGRLRTGSAQHRLTLFVVMLAAFQALLHRLSRQRDVVAGSSAAGQALLNENLVGYCTNLLPLRSKVDGNPVFLDYAASVKKTLLDAFDYQEYPFAKMIRAISIARDPSRLPLVSVVFNMDPRLAGEIEIAGLKMEAFPNLPDAAKYDINLNVTQAPDHLRLDWEYNSELFDAPTIERWHSHLVSLLESFLANPIERFWTMPLLSENEQKQLITAHDHRQARMLPEIEAGVHQRVETQVKLRPDAIALSCEGTLLSYRELNGRANKLAHHLRELGAGAESLVAVYTERTPEMTISLLGILKSGAAYLPLEPSLPQERLSYMLEDSGARLLVACTRPPQDLSISAGRAIYLDEDWPRIANKSADNLGLTALPDNPAYVIYTSGSTGSPKGVAVTHGNVQRLFDATDHGFDFDEHDAWTLFHSYAFDFSVWEMWGALSYGGKLVITPYSTSRSPEAFYDLLCDEGVTVLNQTPSAFRQLIHAEASMRDTKPLALRYVIFGGEALDIPSLAPWFDKHGDETPSLINMYGITETTVHVTYRRMSAKDVESASGSVIGEPIPDLRMRLLDEYLQLMPRGLSGQLCVGGAGLARGYVGRPGLTAERFIPEPFSGRPGERLYLSGDLARHRDGDTEYLGRLDRQVKVRGYRIELGEIEAALMKNPAVAEAVVLAADGAPGQKRLVAYIVPAARSIEAAALSASSGTNALAVLPGGTNAFNRGAARFDDAPAAPAFSLHRIQSYLKEMLPDYMLPAAYVTLEKLPLTSNGKIDRRALPAPGSERPDLQVSYAAPATSTEEVLAAIWAHVLDVHPIGVRDNFFALGGDSIRAIQVLGMARDRGLQVSLMDVFKHPTIRELSDRLVNNGAGSSAVEKSEPFSLISEEDRSLLPDDVEDAYPLTHLQSGMFYHMQLTPEVPVYHNVNSARIWGECDTDLLQVVAERVVARYPILRTSFDFISRGEPLQLVHKSADFNIGVADLRGLPEDEQARIIEQDVEYEKQNRFDYSKPPLIRMKIHRLSNDCYQWTFTDFHPIIDGWGMGAMLYEIFRNYAALLNSETLPEDGPPLVAFRDYVDLERKALRDEAAQRFWEETLAGAVPMPLPHVSNDPSASRLPDVRELDSVIPADVLGRLQALAKSEAIPLQYVLLAAHLKVMGLIAGRSDVITGVTLDGRLEAEGGERTPGLFLNTLPFRYRLGNESWRDMARGVFGAVLSMLPFRRYPMAAIQKNWGLAPLYETAFNFVSFHGLYPVARAGLVSKVETTHFINQTNFPFLAMFILDQYEGLSGNSLTLALHYDANRISEVEVETIRRCYLQAFGRIGADPGALHCASAWLFPDEQDALVRFNATRIEYPAGATIVRLFEEQAELSADSTAVIDPRGHLSYRELHRRSNQMARYLNDLGVGPEVTTAVCTDRSAEMVISILGVLKSGGAYVPMDPDYPSERLAYILEDSRAVVLLTSSDIAQTLPASWIQVVELDRDWRMIDQYADSSVGPEIPGDNLAYLIYTSGSTGRPKGVMVTHGGLANYLMWARAAYFGSGCSASVVHSSISFDLTITALLVPLISGSVVTLAAGSDPVGALEQAAEISDSRTLVKLTPGQLSVARGALLEDRPFGFASTLVIGGEALRWEDLEFWRGRFESIRLINEYGPTETVVGCCVYEAPMKGEFRGAVPIGRPISNTTLYVLDNWRQLTPRGAVGELFIGGAGVSRGYLNRPEITAERFTPDEFGLAEGARLYRTGDLVRRLADGSLEYRGRMDDQVKLRGYRIELGEIEAVLAQHEEVKQCAVVLFGEQGGTNQRLAAYWVPESPGSVSASDLQAYLQAKLPAYMTPSVFVELAELPLTPNGKLDRKSLPAPVLSAQAEQADEPPRTPVEETVARIWAEVLGLDGAGVHRNFFELGGHSLSATQVIMRVREAFDIDISISALFETPTIAGLSTSIEREAGLRETDHLLPT